MGIQELKKQVAAARVFGAGNYLRCGTGVLVVDRIKHDPEAFKGEILVVEFRVESSASDPSARDVGGQPIVANTPGTTVSKVWSLTGENKAMMLGKIKEFFSVLDGDPDCDVGEVLEQACSAAQPCRGMRIKYEAYQTETKKSKKTITVERWSPFPNDEKTMVTGRAFLDT